MSSSLLTPARAGGLVFVAALLVYANSLGNGFAGDDTYVLTRNSVVTEAQVMEAVEAPYWPEARPGTGNYRPLTLLSFMAEWAAFDGSPQGFHAVSVVAHAAVSLLVFLLLQGLVGTWGALSGGLLFAVHPVHVEAVANVVGRAELYAAAAVLGAVLLHWRGAGWTGVARGLRLAGIALLYAVGLASKETAVTLPAVVLLVDLVVRHGEEGGARGRLLRSLPVYLALGAVLVGYLVVRWSVLGAVTGEAAAAGLRSLDTGERLLTALTVWPHYLRLMVAPVDLSMDYQPGVLLPATRVDARVLAGAAVLGAVVWGTVRLARREPVVAAGLGWFLVTVLPVSNLVVRSDVLLAERTLYLPSVGLALVAAGLVPVLRRRGDRRALRLAGVAAGLVLLAFAARTTSRNPVWADSTVALETLIQEHPESYRALLVWASVQKERGELEAAAATYHEAAGLAPDSYLTAVEAATFLGGVGATARADSLFARAVALSPDNPVGYVRWGEYLLRSGRGREAHRTALEGLRRAGAERALLNVLSESYVAKGDLEGAVRARRAALARPEATRNDARRLGVLLEALGRPQEAAAARERGEGLPDAPPPETIR